jgi:cationic peptide transport system permease protein
MTRIKIYREDYIPTPLEQLWKAFAEHHFSLGGLWLLALVLIIIFMSPMLVSQGADAQNIDTMLIPPAWSEIGKIEYLFGTDDLGRDLYSRMILGASLTFGAAVVIVFISMLFGTVIGCGLGMIRRARGDILEHFLEMLLSVPPLLMAILFVGILQPSLYSVWLAIGLSTVPQFIHVIYHDVREEINKDYIVAARLDGANHWQIIWFVILPNLWDTLIVQTTYCLSSAILDIAALGFLGLNGDNALPEWGTMVAQGLDNIWTASWAWLFPGFGILFTVLAVNLVGDGLRAALSPKG